MRLSIPRGENHWGYLGPAATPGPSDPPTGVCVLQRDQRSVIRWCLVSEDFSEIAGTGVL